MKNITLLFFLLFLPSLIVYTQETKDVKLIKDFYFDYYTLLENRTLNGKEKAIKIDNLYVKYLTKRLIKIINRRFHDVDKYDYNPFLQGQDYLDNLLITLKVVYIISNKYEVSFYTNTNKFFFYLKEEDGKIKIDKIKDKYYTW